MISSSGNGNVPDLRQFGLGGLGSTSDLTVTLRDLFKQMGETQEPFPPMMFLNTLRTTFPQFAQRARDGHGYAQQDAEEAWSQVVTQLRQKLKIKNPNEGERSTKPEVSFVDTYMSGKFQSSMECSDPAAKEGGEQPVESEDTFLKLDCHITGETNHLRDGLTAGLKETINKRSEVLGRDVDYIKSSRIARLPKFLPVHFIRFDYRRTTQKKAKIMRKVTFPQELDVVEFCTEELQKMLIPVRDQIRNVQKEEEDVLRAKKRQKRFQNGDFAGGAGIERGTKASGPDSEKQLAEQKKNNAKTEGAKDTEMEDVTYKTDAQIEAERAESILKAKKELLAAVNPKLAADTVACQTGLYELRGVVTHQGVSADSGHYTAFVKKSGYVDPVTGKRKAEDGKWWWFNDDKVSEVDSDRIDRLSGGGKS